MTTDREPGLDATVSAPSDPAARRDDQARPLGPGDTLGRYVLGESVGAGGMGRVFRARDPDLGREVAIKVLHTGGDGSGGALERRLLREAQAMATLSHDHLASVYDIGVSDGRVFVAMELIDGGSLRALIADPARGWREKLAAVMAAGRGLAAAHAAGVIHRDFKPDNVLIARSGRVKVVDFGLARAEPEGDDGARGLPADLSANLTQTGALLGTPAYMAPEQHAGETVDARADQFAFAVTAWEAVYGRRPFPTDTYSSLVEAVQAHRLIAPPRGTGAPPALEAVLRRALARAPRDRYTSMDALLAALEHAIRPRRLGLWLAAGGAVLAAGGVAVVALAGGDDARPTTAPSAGAPAAAAPTERGRAIADVRRAARAAAGRIVPEASEAPGPTVRVGALDLTELIREGARGKDADRLVMLRMQQASVARGHRAEALACYQRAGAPAAGRVIVEYQLDARGKVTAAEILEDGVGAGVAGCVVEASRGWRFPATDLPTTLRLPFVFAPDGAERGDESDGPWLDLGALPGVGGDLPIPSPLELPVPPVPPASPPAPPGSPSAPVPSEP